MRAHRSISRFRVGLAVILITSGTNLSAQSVAPQGITLQGRIIKPDATPLEAASVSFTIEIRSPDPDDCLLYTETQTQVMTGSSGIFSFSVGSGSRSGTNFENVSSLAQVFNNASTVISPVVCTSGATSYTPASTHKRKVRLSFDDGNGPQLISQAMDVQSVPYALYADTLQGKPASGYLQVNTSAGKALSQANLESVFQSSSYVTELLALITGTSTQYATSAGGGGNFNFGTGKFYVDGTSGNVGVGTATPAYLLDVTKSQNASTTINVANANTGATAAATVLTTSDAGTTQMSTVSTAAGGYGRISSSSQSLSLDAQNASGFLSLRTGAAPTERMRITSTGNVGIGTSAPSQKLQVTGGNVILDNTYGIYMKDSSGAGHTILQLFSDNKTYLDGGANGLQIRTNNSATNAVLVDASGNVGIGTTTPQVSLDVGGGARFSGASTVPISGAGLEVRYAYGNGYLQAFDRSGGSYLPLDLDGSILSLNGNSNGYVGIGTTAPHSQLSNTSSGIGDSVTPYEANHGLSWEASGVGYAAGIYNSSNAAGASGLVVATLGTAASNRALNVRSGLGDLMVVQGNGNVGIGTASPGTSLEISQSVLGSAIKLRDTQGVAGDQTSIDFATGIAVDNSEVRSRLTAAVNPGGQGRFDLYTKANGTTFSTTPDLTIVGGNVGIGAIAPAVSLDLGSRTDALRLPSGTTAQEPSSPTAGLIRFNTNAGTPPGWVEFYNGSAWVNLVGSSTAGNLTNVGNITGSGPVTISPGGTTQNLNLSNTTGGAVNVTTSAGNVVLQPGGTGSVTVPNSTASLGTTSGALVVGGGIGVAGAINAGGAIATSSTISAGTSLIAPALYGSTLASQNLSIDSTSNATKGNVLIAPSGGYVGIGTSSPSTNLHVVGTTLSTVGFTTGWGSAASPSFNIGSGVGIYAPNSGGDLGLSVGNTERMRINSAGNVGIGTTSPNAKLHVQGAILALAGADPAAGTSAPYLNPQSGYSANAVYSFYYQNGTGISNPTYDTVGVVTNNAERMRITTGGNVGIGTASPAQLLSVNGDSYLYGNVGIGDFADSSVAALRVKATTSSTGLSILQAGTGSAATFIGGSVGIGTTSPVDALSLGTAPSASATHALLNLSNTSLSGGSANGTYLGANPSTSTADFINFQVGGSSAFKVDFYGDITGQSLYLTGNNGAIAGYDSNLGMKAYSAYQTNYITSGFGASGTYNIVLKPSGAGNVGIGTTTPSYPLSLSNSLGDKLAIYDGGAGSMYGFGIATGRMYMKANGSEIMSFNSGNGNVGIGTTTPAARLQIESTSSASSGSSYGVYSNFVAGPPAGSSGVFRSAYNVTQWNPALNSPLATAEGVRGEVGMAWVGTLGNAYGVAGNVYNIQTATISNTAGVLATVTAGAAGAVNTVAAAGSFAVTQASGGVNATAYGVQIGAVQGTSKWSLYASDSTAPSYFAGNVGIGTTAPGYKLDVSGDVNIASANVLRFGGTQVCATAGCTATSDRRLKEDVQPLQRALDDVLKLQGVTYNWIDKDKYGKGQQVGLIAQDLEKVYPQVVITDPKTGLKSVAYDHLIAPLIEAFKALYGHVLGVEHDVASLKSENAALKAKAEIAAARADQFEHENAEMKVRLDRIEKLLQSK